MAEVLMTQEHYKQLEEKLNELKVNGRREAAERIRVAREFGDLSENAEYDVAKDEQAKLEAEIADIEAKLKNAKIVDEKSKGDKVDFGSKVTIVNLDTNAETVYTIVGSSESDPLNGKISNESPIGFAVLGRKKGETFTAKTPKGNVNYKVVKIS